MVKNTCPNAGDSDSILGLEDCLEGKKWQPNPVVLARKIPWTIEESGGYQSTGLQRVRAATEHAHTPKLRESFYENTMVSGLQPRPLFQPEVSFCGMDHVILPTFQLRKLSFKEANCLLKVPLPPFCSAIQHQNTWACVSAPPLSSEPGPRTSLF